MSSLIQAPPDEESSLCCTSRVVLTSPKDGGLEDTLEIEEGPNEQGVTVDCLKLCMKCLEEYI